MISVRVRLVLLMAALLAVLALPALAQQTRDIPQIAVDNTAEGMTVAGEVLEGLNTFAFNNPAEVPFIPVVARLNEGVTIEAFTDAMMSADFFAIFEVITLLGGPMVEPGESAVVTYEFTPGEYLLLDFANEEAAFEQFTVAEGDGDAAAEPEADVTVRLFDFAFSLPLELSAGEQTWLLDNQGMQWHELGIARIDPEQSVDDYQALLRNLAAGAGPESEDEGGPESVFFWLPMNEGERAWVTLDLEPGTYVIACFLPDVLGEMIGEPGHAHADLGMVNIITVQ